MPCAHTQTAHTHRRTTHAHTTKTHHTDAPHTHHKDTQHRHTIYTTQTQHTYTHTNTLLPCSVHSQPHAPADELWIWKHRAVDPGAIWLFLATRSVWKICNRCSWLTFSPPLKETSETANTPAWKGDFTNQTSDTGRVTWPFCSFPGSWLISH